MQRTIKFEVTNIRDYLNVDLDEAGEIILKQILSGFSCALNPDIENFLKKNAINFAKKNQSVTYLVFQELTLVGYFTLAIKPITVCADGLSNTAKRKLERVGEYDKAANTYKLAAYLIAQLGKNYTNGNNQCVTGKELLELALKQIKTIQSLIGGMFVFVESEEKDELMHFYTGNQFKKFGTRETRGETEEIHSLVQLLKTL